MIDSFAGEPVGDHPSSIEIADYLNGRVSPEARAALEAHLADCRTCRKQVVSARRVLSSFSARRSTMWAIPAVAAAAVAWILLGTPRSPSDATHELLRGGNTPTDGSSRLAIVTPLNDGVVERAGVEFKWHARAGTPLFRLTVSEGNRERWSATTRDTTLRLPASVSLIPGRTYLWYVDALDADGRSVTTGTQRFVVGR